MKIEVWSDIVCPFCYMGKRHVELAKAQFPQNLDIQMAYRSFELDPNATPSQHGNIHELLAHKYDTSVEQAQAMHNQVAERASQVGLVYRFDTMIPANTFDAHRLAQFAKTQGKTAELSERLFRAYFTDSLDIGDRTTLAGLAGEVGLSARDAMTVLESGAYGQEVRTDEREAAELGIDGVPFFVINEKYGISGVQPVAIFSIRFAADCRGELAFPLPTSHL